MSDVRGEVAALLREFRRAAVDDRAEVAARLRALLDGDKRDEARHYFEKLRRAESLETQSALTAVLPRKKAKKKAAPKRAPRVSPEAEECLSMLDACAEYTFTDYAWPSDWAAPTDVELRFEPLRSNVRVIVSFTLDGTRHTIRVVAKSREMNPDDTRACEEHLEAIFGDALRELADSL